MSRNKYLEELRKMGLDKLADVFKALVDARENDKDYGGAERKIRELKKSGLRGQARIFDSLVKILKNADHEEAVNEIEKMRKNKLRQEANLFDDLLDALKYLEPVRAAEYYDETLKIIINLNILGQYHPDIAISHNKFGDLWESSGNHVKSASHYKKALTIDLEAWREPHPYMAERYDKLAWTLKNKGNHVSAASLYKELLSVIEEFQYMAEHPPRPEDYYKTFLEEMKSKREYEKDLKRHEEALEIDWRDVKIADYHNNLGETLEDQGKYDEAVESYEKALEIELNYPDSTLRDAAARYNKLIESLNRQKKYDEAFKRLEEFGPAAEQLKADGEHSLEVARYHKNLGDSLTGLGRNIKAERSYEEEARWRVDK